VSTSFGAILAGGASRRFGTPKALAELQGRPMVRWISDTLLASTTRAVIVGPEGPVTAASGLSAIPDILPGLGPLGGLHAALTWMVGEGGEGTLIVGCDTPLVGERLLDAVRGDGTTTRIVESGGRRHPLCGYYRVETLSVVERRVEAGDLALQALIVELGVDILEADSLLGPAQAERELTNINTPDEFRALQEIAG
jgi:molybdopterin-guanine dinucleotide biosynthesis protein A